MVGPVLGPETRSEGALLPLIPEREVRHVGQLARVEVGEEPRKQALDRKEIPGIPASTPIASPPRTPDCLLYQVRHAVPRNIVLHLQPLVLCGDLVVRAHWLRTILGCGAFLARVMRRSSPRPAFHPSGLCCAWCRKHSQHRQKMFARFATCSRSAVSAFAHPCLEQPGTDLILVLATLG